MKLNVNVQGLDELKLKLAGLERKIPVITKTALNDAAYLGTQKTKGAVDSAFDRATPWIRDSVRYTKATLQKLEAVIDFDKWGNKAAVTAAKVLDAEIHGGSRRHKRHEIALKRLLVLPEGYFIVPGEAAKMDAFGNMSAGQIRQILSYFNAAQMTSGYTANMTAKKRASLAKGNKRTTGFEYFVVKPGQRRQFQRANGKTGTHAMQPGIYQRIFLGHGTAIKPVMIFVRSASYKRRLDFYEIVQRAAQPEFARAFAQYTAQFLRERGL